MKSAIGWVEGRDTHQGWSGGLGSLYRFVVGGPTGHPPRRSSVRHAGEI